MTHFVPVFTRYLLGTLLLSVTIATVAQAQMPATIAYQGYLTNPDGDPANGTAPVTFSLYNSATNSERLWQETQQNVVFTEGIFSVQLGSVASLEAVPFDQTLWLGVSVAGGDELTPRVVLGAVPYALSTRGLRVVPGRGPNRSPNLIGGHPDNRMENLVEGAVIGGGGGESDFVNRVLNEGGFAMIGGGLGNVASGFGTTIGGGTSNETSATRATVSGGANNTASEAYATVSGGLRNAASSNSATIGGGSDNTASGEGATIAGGFENDAGAEQSTIGGGANNTASGEQSTVGGGRNNTADRYATIGGGQVNRANGFSATIGGGTGNVASGEYATVGGGQGNEATGDNATVGGGRDNRAAGLLSMVPGGFQTHATGFVSFAAGYNARAVHDGAFVWTDTEGIPMPFSSTAPDQFLIRASGGVGIGTNAPQGPLHVTSETQNIDPNGLSDDALVVEGDKPVIGIYAAFQNNTRPGLVLAGVNENGNVVDKWGIVREFFAGNALHFTYGLNEDHTQNSTVMTLSNDSKSLSVPDGTISNRSPPGHQHPGASADAGYGQRLSGQHGLRLGPRPGRRHGLGQSPAAPSRRSLASAATASPSNARCPTGPRPLSRPRGSTIRSSPRSQSMPTRPMWRQRFSTVRHSCPLIQASTSKWSGDLENLSSGLSLPSHFDLEHVMSDRFLYGILVLATLSLGALSSAQAQQLVLRTSIFSAGGQQSTGGNLVLQSTVGQPGIGQAAGGTLLLEGGFWIQVTNAAGPLALPTATNDVATTAEDTAVAIDVLANDTDSGSGGTLTIVGFGTPEHGEVTQTGDATFAYTPEADFFGEDQFAYTVQNEQGGQAQATVTVTVNPVNDAPVFTSTPVAGVGIDAEYRYVAKATDIEGDALTYTAPVLPPWLALGEQTDSTATLAGTPTAADAGEHTVTLALSDGQDVAEQTFTVTVTATVPGPSTLLLPEDEALVDPTSGVSLAWRAVSGAASYDLQLATVEDFSSFESFVVGITDTTWSLFALDDNLAYFWRIRAVNSVGNGAFTDAFRFSTGMSVATEEETGVPSAFALHPNYPNPFNPTTTLAYDLPRPAAVTLTVYDVQGREVRRFVQGMQPAGRYDLSFEAGDLGSGTYFYRLEAGPYSQSRSFVLLK